VRVSYATSDGTAGAGDYTTSSGTLTFSQGEFSKDFIVPVTDDVDFEGDETVNLALSNPAGCVLGNPASAVLTIIDNDQSPTPSPTPSPVLRPHESIQVSPHSELSYLYENGVLSWVVSGPLYSPTKVAYNIFYGLSTLL
jgi:hypothetical protein